MQGSIWLMLAFIALAGAVGGIANALMTENGFLMPRSEKTSAGSTIVRPGYLGNIFVGSVASIISWGLYGPLSSYFVAGTVEALKANSSPQNVGLTLASLVGGLLVGVGGARWLSNEVDKSLLRAAATQAAGKNSSPGASQQMALASPAEALNIARAMP
jgi:hypothetical protein